MLVMATLADYEYSKLRGRIREKYGTEKAGAEAVREWVERQQAKRKEGQQ